ncbi:cephalosporin-C deacetylase [Microbacterium sp. AG1240]|uniref:acetylxylan esterase n=1 Tax=Microbacterium sp. AG1240 TaxID=2183992 RepID=UPI000EAD8926|nr:acetylxylan esterase [Microbacterium sp. AG1240]RKT31621.1 cephalosporin-C deacetylase [Microbacterium sp. AG1240]
MDAGPLVLEDANPRRHPVEVPMPADFDDYWAEAEAYLDREAPDAQRVAFPERSGDGVEVAEVLFTSAGGLRISGWYTYPSGAERGSLPGLLLIPGYISDPPIAKSWAVAGYAVLSIAPRGKVRSRDVVDPGYPGLLVDGIADPRSATYRDFYLDTVRAFDVLRSMPEVDEDRVGVHGSSQGGGLAVAVAALRPDEVRCVSAGAPYLCGIMDSVRLTRTYPYQEIRELLHVHPELTDTIARSYAYLDCINLAPRVAAPTQIYIGLQDDVCPPETAYALADAMTSPVEFLAYEGCAHNAGLPWVASRIDSFLAEHLRPNSAAEREADRSGSNA